MFKYLKSPFDSKSPLEYIDAKKLFIKKRKEFLNNTSLNLKFFLSKRYDFINKYISNKKDIIEIGSGAGLSEFYINKKYLKSDIIENKWIDLCFNCEEMPLPNKSFEAIFTCDTILHLKDPKNFFYEANRILKDFGILIINDINLSFLHKILIHLFRHLSINEDLDLIKSSNNINQSPFSSNAKNLDLILKNKKKFEKEFGFKLVHEERGDFILYLLTGGISTNIRFPNLPKIVLKLLGQLDLILTSLFPSIFSFSKRIVLIKSELNISQSYVNGFGQKEKKHIYEIDHSFKIEFLKKIKQIKLSSGNNKSYGDISYLTNSVILSPKNFNKIIKIDYKNEIIIAQSGVLLSDINNKIKKRKYIIPVTPGFESVTIGGSISNNVHGKNFSIKGAFIDHVKWVKVLVNDKIIQCSRNSHSDLFFGIFGGIGLIGIIIEACIVINRISSFNLLTVSEIYKNKNFFLEDLKKKSLTYDYCYGIFNFSNLGYHIINVAKYSNDNKKTVERKKNLLHTFFLKIFLYLSGNRLLKYLNFSYIFYIKYKNYSVEHINNYLFQYSNTLKQLNIIQIQFVISDKYILDVINQIFLLTNQMNNFPILVTTKYFNRRSGKHLSFPEKGYTFTFDFKNIKKSELLINKIIEIVISCQGKIYLAKDSLMTAKQISKIYDIKKFKKLKKKYKTITVSDASKRLGL